MTTDELPPSVLSFTGGFPTDLVLGAAAFDGAVGQQLADELAERLAAIAEARGFPLHTTIAFNALHWGYDPAVGYLDSAPLDAEITVCTGDRAGVIDALPVGAWSWLRAGNREPQWVELVAKDGRLPSGGDGTMDPSQTPARSAETVSETWRLDFHEFSSATGAAATVVDRTIARWIRAGDLDHRGLIVAEARYPDVAAANDDDVAYFSRWAIEHLAEPLAAGPLGGSLIERPDPRTRSGRDRLGAALVAALSAIEAALEMSELFVRWGDYWIPTAWVDAVDEHPDLPFGRADLEFELASIAKSSPTGSPGFATLGPRLDELAANTVSAAGGDLGADPLAGRGWLRYRLVAARWIGDRLNATGGIVLVGSGRRYVRVDDRWPYGGTFLVAGVPPASAPIWLANPDEPLYLGTSDFELLDGDPHDVSTADEPADVGDMPTADADREPSLAESADEEPAAGRTEPDQQPHQHDDIGGAAHDDADGETGADPGADPQEGHTDADTAPDVATSADPTPTPPADVDEVADDQQVTDTYVDATISVRATDLDNGTCQLPNEFDWLHDASVVHLHIRHDGWIDDDQRDQDVSSTGGLMTGISWPVDFERGWKLFVAGVHGQPALYIATRRDANGEYAADTPSTSRHADHAALTLATLTVDALRRTGRATYGTKRASAEEIIAAMFGSHCLEPVADAVRHELDRLVAAKRLALAGTEYSITDITATKTIARFTPSGQNFRTIARHEVRVHTVQGFYRRLPYGWAASDTQRALHRRLYGQDIPSGFTWVSEHSRGEDRIALRRALTGATNSAGVITEQQAEQYINETYQFGRQR